MSGAPQKEASHTYSVRGFVRDDATGDILLVRQISSSKTAGLLSGLVGHVENIARDTEHSPYAIGRVAGYRQITPDYEYPVMSMLRACFEETGLFIPAQHWVELGTLGGEGHDFTVFVYGTSWSLGKAQARHSPLEVMPLDKALIQKDLAPSVLLILQAMV